MPLSPGLAPLNDATVAMAYHDVLPGSPLIDAGKNSLATDVDGGGLAFDQRGAVRRIDGDGNGVSTVDIGAVEFVPPVALAVSQRQQYLLAPLGTPLTTSRATLMRDDGDEGEDRG